MAVEYDMIEHFTKGKSLICSDMKSEKTPIYLALSG